jgi:hypothetical protein
MNSRWTTEEIETLKKLYNSSTSMKEISSILNRTYLSVRSKAVELRLSKPGKIKRKHSVDDSYFEKIDTIEKAYIFGLWCSDGCISEKNRFDISQHSQDEYILLKIKDILKYTGPLRNNGPLNKRLTISSTKICEDIKNLGGMERKSIVMPFPNIPKEYYFDFIRGYCDGDGSVLYRKPKNRNKYYLFFQIIGGFEFLQHIKKYVMDEFNLDISLRIIKKHNNFSILSATGKKARKFLDLMYQNVNEQKADLFIERKYRKYKKDVDNSPKPDRILTENKE